MHWRTVISGLAPGKNNRSPSGGLPPGKNYGRSSRIDLLKLEIRHSPHLAADLFDLSASLIKYSSCYWLMPMQMEDLAYARAYGEYFLELVRLGTFSDLDELITALHTGEPHPFEMRLLSRLQLILGDEEKDL